VAPILSSGPRANFSHSGPGRRGYHRGMSAPPPAAGDDRGPRAWLGSDLNPGGFAATEPEPLGVPALFDAKRVFDVCHVGVVLRALLGVQACLALGMGLAAGNPTQWALLTASGTVVSLTAVLLWLVTVCALQKLLARAGRVWQWLALMGLGALCAGLGWRLLVLVSPESENPFRQAMVMLTGAVMAASLFYWMRQRERMQRPALATARLVELQSRIRPHFLFNTLNTAIALVRVDPHRAEEVLEDLAEVFRVALMEGGEAVSLAQEIELARRYLAIEQIRFGERLRVRWDLAPGAGSARVPPLLLQPLVENAVRHGVEPNEGGGDVLVQTQLRGSEVVVNIVNTVSAQASTPGHGMALGNVRERLRLMHDVAAQFELRRDAHEFRIHLVIPR
jgi:two-component system sensor histidine kinase AlgZ